MFLNDGLSRGRAEPAAILLSSLLLSSLELGETNVYELKYGPPRNRDTISVKSIASGARVAWDKSRPQLVRALGDEGALGGRHAGDTTTCRMTGMTLHSHVRYKEI